MCFEGGEVNYDALVDYVIGSCRAYPDECCLPLANIELRETDKGWKPDIDNSYSTDRLHAALAVSPYQFASKKR